MVKLNKIYTRTGDDGTTGLVDGSRIAKNDQRMAAIGDVDELNSVLGVAICEIADDTLVQTLRVIQNDLFDLGADLATPAAEGDDFTPSEMVLRVVPSQVERLEKAIDAATAELDPLTSFILPGGTKAAAAIHLVRAVARRTERTCVAAGRATSINPQALAYINRLSDYMFVVGRALNRGGKDDILWVPGASR
ncbi:cob(I)yrinic acid a,c-diamide adenosyltransferase [Sphingorhabdus sp. 109]|jgi:cob(I)alamin adenosyltransferase|uniref:cob(I)yrinic acid a,c-diamide adenosyltransferase n=1 Tax=Sphingorhabdus sp. 109 TaxID=2653173 RepID=UPI0012F26EE0|nr:cob(I)yrinic acid a,c-diamide adenosyltransferase [Sphingorhabdus sp. 109]VWX61609.1 Corrinoid adenosyltransferase [Sphingorhabdus sp. 109]